jgi:hypothetical protein
MHCPSVLGQYASKNFKMAILRCENDACFAYDISPNVCGSKRPTSSGRAGGVRGRVRRSREASRRTSV